MNFATLILKNIRKTITETYSTHNEGKSVVAERFIKTLKNKIYKYSIANSENMYFNVSNDIVDKYNNIYHKTIKMKPIDVKSDSSAELGDHVRISKYKNSFAKGYSPN